MVYDHITGSTTTLVALQAIQANPYQWNTVARFNAAVDTEDSNGENTPIICIENSLNAEKPDLSGSTTKLARLKSEINKAHNYSDFLKTKEGKQIIMLDNKLIKMKMNRR